MMRWQWFAVLLVGVSAQTGMGQFRLDITRMADTSANAWDDESSTTEVTVDPGARVWPGNLMVAGRGEAIVVWNIDGVAVQRRNGLLVPELDRFRKSMMTEINLLAVEFQLNDEQREKLMLAGQRDIVKIGEMMAPSRANGAELNQALLEIRNAQRIVKEGAFADDTMVSKVAGRILSGSHASSQQQDRIRYAYRSVLRLIVTELDLVHFLDKQQRLEIENWIDSAEAPESMSLEQIYLVAIDDLRNADPLANVLSHSQRTQLDQMRKRITVGAVRPTGMIKSRRSMASSMRKRR